MRRSLIIALIALGVFAAAAPAKDLEFRVPEAGPVIAGDRLAWVESEVDRPVGGGLKVVSQRPDGTGRVVTRIRMPDHPYPEVSIAASPRRITVVATEIDGDGVARVVAGHLWSGRPWRPLTRERGCKVFVPPALATDEAWGAGCNGRLVTREGSDPMRFGPAVPRPPLRVDDSDMAGPFLATRLGDRSQIGVFDRRTGVEVYRVAPGVSDDLALDDDGSIAFPLSDGRVGWASIAEPAVHVLPIRGPRVRVGIDGGRVATQTFGPDPTQLTDGSPLRIVRFDGTLVKSSRNPGAWDFADGRLVRTYATAGVTRAAWVVRVP